MILLDVDGFFLIVYPIWDLLTPLFEALGSSGWLSHHNGHHWGLLHCDDLGVQLGVAALAADAAGHAGGHNAQDARQPTKNAQVDEDHSQGLAGTERNLRSL